MEFTIQNTAFSEVQNNFSVIRHGEEPLACLFQLYRTHWQPEVLLNLNRQKPTSSSIMRSMYIWCLFPTTSISVRFRHFLSVIRTKHTWLPYTPVVLGLSHKETAPHTTETTEGVKSPATLVGGMTETETRIDIEEEKGMEIGTRMTGNEETAHDPRAPVGTGTGSVQPTEDKVQTIARTGERSRPI